MPKKNATIQCRFLSYVYNPFYSTRLIKYSTVPFYLLLWPMNSYCNTGTFLQFLLVVSLAAFTKNMFLSESCRIQVLLLNGSNRETAELSVSAFVSCNYWFSKSDIWRSKLKESCKFVLYSSNSLLEEYGAMFQHWTDSSCLLQNLALQFC